MQSSFICLTRNQREYFFNKNSLDLTIFSGATEFPGTYSLAFRKIRMVETDMIPFFQFASDCVVFKTFAIWDETPPESIINQGPNGQGTWNLAKPIGDGDGDGNLLVDDSFGLPTWDNFYLAGDGSGCISYVNKDIQIPYIAMAPDIDLSDSNFSYLNSITVTIPNNNVIVQSSSVINGNSVLRLRN